MTRKFYNAKSSKPDEKALIKEKIRKPLQSNVMKKTYQTKTTKIVPIFAAR
jgi:hypothetical protein